MYTFAIDVIHQRPDSSHKQLREAFIINRRVDRRFDGGQVISDVPLDPLIECSPWDLTPVVNHSRIACEQTKRKARACSQPNQTVAKCRIRAGPRLE